VYVTGSCFFSDSSTWRRRGRFVTGMPLISLTMSPNRNRPSAGLFPYVITTSPGAAPTCGCCFRVFGNDGV
jgi:hypothetical protein